MDGRTGLMDVRLFQESPTRHLRPIRMRGTGREDASRPKKEENGCTFNDVRLNVLVLLGTLSPQESAWVLDNIASVVWQWLETLGKALMSNVTLMIMGPHPGQGGQIDYALDLRPKDWSEVGGGKGHDQAMELFMGFARSCFTPQEMRACALKVPDSPASVEKTIVGIVGMDNDSVVVEAGVEPEGSKKKCKKRLKKMKATGEKENDNAILPPTKCVKTMGLQDVSNSVMPVNICEYVSVHDKDDPMDVPSNSEELQLEALELLPNINPVLQQLSDHPVNITHLSSSVDPSSAMLNEIRNGTDSPKSATSELPSSPTIFPLLPAPNAEPIIGLIPLFPVTVADLTLLDRDVWPEWFEGLMEYLEGYDLGCKERPAIKWTPSRGGNMDQVLQMLKLSHCTKHSEELEWCNIVAVEGPLGDECRGPLEGDWEGLVKHGQNGYVSPIACLAWWGQAVGDGDVELHRNWELALEECHHVLLNLLTMPVM
ncbi:hypothetical protein EDD18DRAFT_1110253 [Armillaria luteobubalina]|uniref:Uncharacterized protein n=1 Tax=Armillaria luteobubalina TaxID=153913 RepID=A0AA39TGY0_9AGAR|nr:hypothetical protein EDD18DRAFT_1110253 [Armillaria luteobubalina]